MRKRTNIPTTSGIYTIENLLNHKLYVGYATNFQGRYDQHINHLRKNKHANTHLQNSWNLETEDNFDFDVLEEWGVEFLANMENYWCNLLNTHDDRYGYNIQSTSPYGPSSMAQETKDKIGKANKGLKRTKEFREAVSKRRKGLPFIALKGKPSPLKGKKHTLEQLKNRKRSNLPKSSNLGKSVIMMDLNRNIIKEWTSATKAGKELNVSSDTIARKCNNENLLSKKGKVKEKFSEFIFEYKYEKDKGRYNGNPRFLKFKK